MTASKSETICVNSNGSGGCKNKGPNGQTLCHCKLNTPGWNPETGTRTKSFGNFTPKGNAPIPGPSDHGWWSPLTND